MIYCNSTFEASSIIKYADDSRILGLLQHNEVDHGPVLDRLLGQCKESFLECSVAKIKDMRFVFCRNPLALLSTIINGSAVETISQ